LQYFGHPKYGTFVLTLGQDTSASSLIDLGAYGSTMEEALPAENPWSLQYVVPSIPQSALTAYCQALPPLYSQSIGVMPRQVSDQSLIDAVTEGLPLTARRAPVEA
jgi:cytosine deaminase